MRKKLLLTLLAVVTALCMVFSVVGCNKNKDDEGAKTTYTVTVQASEHGTVTASAETVEKGGTVTLTVTPDEHYVLDELKVNDAAVTVTGNTYEVKDVSSDITVAATFKEQQQQQQPPVEQDKDSVTVTFDYGAGSGSEPTRTVKKGTSIGALPEVKAPANSMLYGWYDADGVAVGEDYTVTDGVTLTASYITAVISLKAGSGTIATIGLEDNDMSPEAQVAVTLDGEATEETVTLETTNAQIATISDGKVTAVSAGKVNVVAKLGAKEVSRSNFVIDCRDMSDYTAISNKDELLALKSDRTGKYCLVADIDFGGSGLWIAEDNYEPLFGVFTGTFDGLGHKVYNATAHPSRYDQGAFISVGKEGAEGGVVRDVASTQIRTETNTCANNGFFGTVHGVVENVFLDIDYRYEGRYTAEVSWAALADILIGEMKNCVVNLNVSATNDADYIAGIAVNAGKWTAKAENIFIVTNGNKLTENFDGLFYKETAEGVADYIAVNSAAENYLIRLINSQAVNISALSDAWQLVDNALYFRGALAVAATPEYVITPSSDVEYIYRDLTDVEGVDVTAVLYDVKFTHNGLDMEGVPEGVEVESSAEDVAELEYIEDDGLFVLHCKSAGVAVITIKVGKDSASFTVTLTEIGDITTVEQFVQQVKANPAGTFKLAADIDFEGAFIGLDDGDAALADTFTGELDGQGHVIKNFKLPENGMFRQLQGTVKNIAFVNVIGSETANGGLFKRIIDGGAVIENVYLDYVVSSDSEGKTGTLGSQMYGAEIKGALVNVRFADGLVVGELQNVGAVMGEVNAWAAHQTDVHVIVNGVAPTAVSAAVGGDAVGNFANVGKFAGYADFYNGATKSVYTEENGWKFEVSGITFGESAVLEIVEYTITPVRTIVTAEIEVPEEGEDPINYDPIELKADVYHYIDKLEEYPEDMTVVSSDEEVATVEIAGDGKIVVTPLTRGETTVTIAIGDFSADILVRLTAPAVVELHYDGDAELTLEYEEAGDRVDIAITATGDGEPHEIPATVTLTSTNSAVANFVYDDASGLIKIELNGAGSAELTATVAASNSSVSVNVNVERIFHIATAQEFIQKMMANSTEIKNEAGVITGYDVVGHYVVDADLDFRTHNGGWVMRDDGSWKNLATNFNGILDGQGHTLSNMTLLDGWSAGMFIFLKGTVKNAAFINVSNSSDGANNYGGLFLEIHDGATVENIYVDYLMRYNGNAEQKSGPLAGKIYDATVKNVVINMRFADGMNAENITNIGAVTGKANSYNVKLSDVKVLLNGIAVNVLSNSNDGPAKDDFNVCEQYDDYAAFKASDFTAFDSKLWTIAADGITFGNNKVLTVTPAVTEPTDPDDGNEGGDNGDVTDPDNGDPTDPAGGDPTTDPDNGDPDNGSEGGDETDPETDPADAE